MSFNTVNTVKTIEALSKIAKAFVTKSLSLDLLKIYQMQL
jgi:hypothetical protein